ncbi:hypothetical protein [Anabaena lutea]|nr:hypothetical protein [Anabaena lutea]
MRQTSDTGDSDFLTASPTLRVLFGQHQADFFDQAAETVAGIS